MKVSKEAMAGLWNAIEFFLTTGHEAEYRMHLAQARVIAGALLAEPSARCVIEDDWEDWPAPVVRIAPVDQAAWRPHVAQTALPQGEPAVHIDLFKGDLLVSTHCLNPGEELVVARRLKTLLSA